MTPGDAFIDPLIKRGEELERIRPAGGVLTEAEAAELASIKAYAKTKLAHLAAYPLGTTSAEESAMDLAWEEKRSAEEREAALHAAWQVVKPVLWEAFKAGMAAAITKR